MNKKVKTIGKEINEEKRSPTAVIPLIYERAFDYVINQDKENLEYFIDSLIKLKNNEEIVMLSTNVPLQSVKEKKKQMDFVYRINDIYINVELNTHPSETLRRNVRYLGSLHARNVNINDRYDKYTTIQVNINKENSGRKRKMKREILLKDEEIYDRNLKIYVINLPNLKKMWYTNSELIEEDLKIFICFFMEDLKDYEELRKNERIDRIMCRMEEYSKSETEWISYRDENEIELTHKYGLELAREEGEKKGRRIGRKEGKLKGLAEGLAEGMMKGINIGVQNVALNMIKEDTDINTIMRFTGLSKNEIMALK